MWCRWRASPNRAMSDLVARLQSLAAAEETITYGALARELGWRIGVLTAALEAQMEADHAAGRPFLAAVCAGRLTGDMPATGFFLKAAELGLDVQGERGLVQRQRAALRALYGGATPPA
jgi:hypothetical protein